MIFLFIAYYIILYNNDFLIIIMFRPINEFEDCNINIETSLSNLLNLESKLFDIEKLEKINIQTLVHQKSLIETFKLSILHTLKQDFKKQILEEKKKMLEYEIKKNNYIIYIASCTEIDSKKKVIFVPPIYPFKHI